MEDSDPFNFFRILYLDFSQFGFLFSNNNLRQWQWFGANSFLNELKLCEESFQIKILINPTFYSSLSHLHGGFTSGRTGRAVLSNTQYQVFTKKIKNLSKSSY